MGEGAGGGGQDKHPFGSPSPSSPPTEGRGDFLGLRLLYYGLLSNCVCIILLEISVAGSQLELTASRLMLRHPNAQSSRMTECIMSHQMADLLHQRHAPDRFQFPNARGFLYG